MGLRLFLQAVEEILDQFLGGHPLELFLVHPQGPGDLAGVFQPFVEEGPGDLRQLHRRGFLEFHAPKMMGKDPVIAVEIPLALHEDGPGRRVEIFQGMNQPQIQGLVEPEKGSRRHGNTPVAQGVEKIYEHLW